jgi:hypothetical protein
MTLRTLAATLLAASLAPGEDAVELKLSMKKGASMKVEQTVDVNGTGGKPSGTPGRELPFVRGAWSLKEAWTELCDADVDGRPAAFKRTWTSSKSGLTGRGLEPNAQEAAAATIEPKDDGTCRVAATKGTVPPGLLDVLLRGPADPVLILLPKAAVKAGDEWKIPASEISRFYRLAASGLAGASRPGDFAKLLEEFKSTKDSPEAQEITARLAAVAKGEATIEFSGQRDDGSAMTDVKGTLKWSVARGRPIQLDWSMKHEMRANDELRTGPWSETFKLARTWK